MEPLDPPWSLSQPEPSAPALPQNPLKSTPNLKPTTKSTTDPSSPQQDLSFEPHFTYPSGCCSVAAKAEGEAATCTETVPVAAPVAAAAAVVLRGTEKLSLALQPPSRVPWAAPTPSPPEACGGGGVGDAVAPALAGAVVGAGAGNGATGRGATAAATSAPPHHQTMEDELVIVEEVLDDDDDEDDDDAAVAAPTSTIGTLYGVHKAQTPPPSSSLLQPDCGPSTRTSKSLSPHAAPFHPGGSSVGRSKARRWADADPDAASSDDEPTPATPSAGAVVATQLAATVVGAQRVPARGRRHRRRCRRRSSTLAGRETLLPQSARVPAQRRLGLLKAARVPVHQRLGPRRRAPMLDVTRQPHCGPIIDADGFQMVVSRRHRRFPGKAAPKRRRPVPPELVGRCFNCLARDHVAAQCHSPSRCFRCRDTGHRARACNVPGGTSSAHSTSSGSSPSVPVFGAPSAPPPAAAAVALEPIQEPPVPDPPAAVEPVVLPRSAELEAAMQALSRTLVSAVMAFVKVAVWDGGCCCVGLREGNRPPSSAPRTVLVGSMPCPVAAVCAPTHKAPVMAEAPASVGCVPRPPQQAPPELQQATVDSTPTDMLLSGLAAGAPRTPRGDSALTLAADALSNPLSGLAAGAPGQPRGDSAPALAAATTLSPPTGPAADAPGMPQGDSTPATSSPETSPAAGAPPRHVSTLTLAAGGTSQPQRPAQPVSTSPREVEMLGASSTDFIASFRKPIPQPLLSTPVLRTTRVLQVDDGDDFVPKRSARLAAKSKFREARPEAQARKVMMKKLGFEVETVVPDEATFEEFQLALKKPLTPSKREAMQALFQGRKQLARLAVSAA